MLIFDLCDFLASHHIPFTMDYDSTTDGIPLKYVVRFDSTNFIGTVEPCGHDKLLFNPEDMAGIPSIPNVYIELNLVYLCKRIEKSWELSRKTVAGYNATASFERYPYGRPYKKETEDMQEFDSPVDLHIMFEMQNGERKATCSVLGITSSKDLLNALKAVSDKLDDEYNELTKEQEED